MAMVEQPIVDAEQCMRDTSLSQSKQAPSSVPMPSSVPTSAAAPSPSPSPSPLGHHTQVGAPATAAPSVMQLQLHLQHLKAELAQERASRVSMQETLSSMLDQLQNRGVKVVTLAGRAASDIANADVRVFAERAKAFCGEMAEFASHILSLTTPVSASSPPADQTPITNPSVTASSTPGVSSQVDDVGEVLVPEAAKKPSKAMSIGSSAAVPAPVSAATETVAERPGAAAANASAIRSVCAPPRRPKEEAELTREIVSLLLETPPTFSMDLCNLTTRYLGRFNRKLNYLGHRKLADLIRVLPRSDIHLEWRNLSAYISLPASKRPPRNTASPSTRTPPLPGAVRRPRSHRSLSPRRPSAVASSAGLWSRPRSRSPIRDVAGAWYAKGCLIDSRGMSSCVFFNDARCRNAGSSCRYVHRCAVCCSESHGRRHCSRKAMGGDARLSMPPPGSASSSSARPY